MLSLGASAAAGTISHILKAAPEAGVFLAIALGYLLGRISFWGISLGSTAGTLLAAFAIGQFDLEVSPVAKSLFFAIFIFAMGFKVGPQFIASLSPATLREIVLALVVAVTALAMAVVFAKLIGLDKGMAAGLAAGSCTESTMVGTASDAIGKLTDVSAEEIKRLQANVAIGYAITYLFGAAGLVVFLTNVGPRILGINLREAAQRLEEELSGGAAKLSAGEFRAYRPFESRAFRSRARWKSAADLERSLGDRSAVIAVDRAGRRVEAADVGPIRPGEVVALEGRCGAMIHAADIVGDEVDDPVALSHVAEETEIVVTSREVAGRSLGELGEQGGRGVFLKQLTRQGRELPFTTGTTVERGDVLRVVGPLESVAATAARVGYADRPSDASDIVLLCVGVVLGLLIGRLGATVAGISISLGSGGGALIAGLIAGWLRSRYRLFGGFPPAAVAVISDLGLCMFIAMVGISAGPSAIEAMKEHGLALLFAGMLVTLVPPTVGLLFGRYLLRMKPVELLGAVAGSRCSTPSINALTDAAGNLTPALGFTVPYAVGNVLLTMAGPVVVALA
jgi:putative transport protein